MMVNLCAFGETLLCKELPDIVYHILAQGHYINITNNGTITQRLEEILSKSKGMHQRLCFAFSLHYNELKKKGLLDTFANNVRKVRDTGCSFLVQLNLVDEYIACIDEIKEYCDREFGSLPQIALTRREGSEYEILTDYPDYEYVKYGRSFHSPLFEFTCKNFNIKRREFCYAGEWSFKLDLASGELKSCYFCKPFYNIYDNPSERIKTLTVGNNCGSRYCVNSSHFMSLGVIPEIKCPTYVALRNRDGMWYTPEMSAFLSQKLYENNRQHGRLGQYFINEKFLRIRHGRKMHFYLSRMKKRWRGILKQVALKRRKQGNN